MWPPPGVSLAALGPGLLATAALLTSAVLVWRGLKMARAADFGGLVREWTIGLALGAAFVVIAAAQWASVSPDNAYGMAFRVMVGYHLLHAVAVGLFMVTVIRSVRAGRVTVRDLWRVEAGARLWYFVAVAWVLFFVPLYLV